MEQRLADDKHVSPQGSEVKKEKLKKPLCMCFLTLLLFVYEQERLNRSELSRHDTCGSTDYNGMRTATVLKLRVRLIYVSSFI